MRVLVGVVPSKQHLFTLGCSPPCKASRADGRAALAMKFGGAAFLKAWSTADTDTSGHGGSCWVSCLKLFMIRTLLDLDLNGARVARFNLSSAHRSANPLSDGEVRLLEIRPDAMAAYPKVAALHKQAPGTVMWCLLSVTNPCTVLV